MDSSIVDPLLMFQNWKFKIITTFHFTIFVCLLITFFFITGSCDDSLGMESGAIPDDAITASSSYVPNVGPKNGRYVMI